MKQRNLGAAGPAISEVGVGCWQFGGDWGPMTEPTAMAILSAAMDQGIDFLDTADVYGNGISESIIGRFLKQTAHAVKVATKYGRGAGVYPDGYSLESMRRCVEGSVQRLGVDSLDLLQLHCVPQSILEQGSIFEWLRELKSEGLIKQFGASVESVEEGLICLRQKGLLSLQVIYNIFRQKLTTDLLPQAQQTGVGIVVRLPLASGLLAGKFDHDTTFAETDHRNFNRDGQCFNVGETFAGLPYARGVELADAIKPLVPDGMTMAQMALRWVLDHEAVSVIIPGASSAEQATSNAAVSSMDRLPDELHKRLTEFYTKSVESDIRGPY